MDGNLGQFLKCPEAAPTVSHAVCLLKRVCPAFSWGRVNFPPSSCCGLDLVREESC